MLGTGGKDYFLAYRRDWIWVSKTPSDLGMGGALNILYPSD